MQVASASVSDALKAELTSVKAFHFQQNTQIRVKEPKQISPAGLIALDKIAASTKLSLKEKHTLIRLVAMVDEFAGGDPRLMSKIMAIAHVMEANSKKTYPPMMMREAMKAYLEARESLSPSKEAVINIQTEINAVSVEHTGVIASDAMQQAGLAVPDSASDRAPIKLGDLI